MLAANGFKTVYNVAGGIRGWQAETAVGPKDLGVHLFSNTDCPKAILKAAFSLEAGLQDFYIEMAGRADNPKVKSLFEKLSAIEVKHQESIVAAYQALGNPEIGVEELSKMVTDQSMEGGMTTEEYLDLFKPDLGSEIDVVSLAMSIEAQALDLYQRLAVRIDAQASKSVVLHIADEEKIHLASLGRLLDEL